MAEEFLSVGALDNVEPTPEVVVPTPEVVEEDKTIVEEVAPQQAPTE